MPTLHETANEHNARRDDLELVLANIPAELKPLRQWVLYRLGPISAKGKRDKTPINPHTGDNAAVNDLATWGTLDEVITAYIRGNSSGIGFVFTASDPYVGIDLDGCRDPQTGHIQPWALDIVQRVNSYTDASPSGTGVHIIAKGKLPSAGGGKEGQVEIYEKGRFFTMTGEHIAGTPTTCEERQDAITDLYHQYFPHKLNGNGFDPGKRTQAKMSERERHETFAELKEALPFIPAIEHDIWLQVGMGLHFLDNSETSFALWVEWSKTCPEKFDFADCLKRWRSFHDDGGITHKSIFALAIKHGWRIDRSGSIPPDPDWSDEDENAYYTQQERSLDDPPEPDWSDCTERTIENRDALPQIVVNNRHLRDLLDESLDALRKSNTPPVLFERSSLLVKVQRDERNQPFISTVSEPVLRESLTRSADFVKNVESKEGGKTISVSPPRDVVQTLHARGSWQLPALVGVCECPVLRPDGTVLSAPGYDPATMLFYDPAPSLTLHPLSEVPTQAQAQAAAQFLFTELYSDFPFCEPADKANMLACLLTPIVRPAIPGCVPICLIDKPSPGSGATLLADVVSTVATGTYAAKEMLPTGRQSEEEMRKKITALLIAAKDVIVLDNVESALASSALSAVLTTPLWEDRILGKNETIALPVRATWIATGNNFVIRGDIARRSYRVRIDAKQDRPWTRDGFRHADLLSWTREHRGELLHALLTMARAWFAAGKPRPKTTRPKVGGFEGWVSIISGILAYAEVKGFLGNLEELYSLVDEDAQQWRTFIGTWYELLGEQPITVANVAGFAQENPAFLETIPDALDWDPTKFDSFRKKLGKALKKRLDRHFDEYRLEQALDDKHAKVARWRVKKCGVCGV